MKVTITIPEEEAHKVLTDYVKGKYLDYRPNWQLCEITLTEEAALNDEYTFEFEDAPNEEK